MARSISTAQSMDRNHGRNQWGQRRVHGKRAYAGLLPGVPCGTAVRQAVNCHGGDCPTPTVPQREPCPPQRECPPQMACPEQDCPKCPACPEHDCPECPEWEDCPGCEACPDCPVCAACPPCPVCDVCPPCEECPPYGCEDACATLFGEGTDDFNACVQRLCEEAPPTDDEEECFAICKQAYSVGELSDAEMLLCLYDCCIAEGVAAGYSAEEAARLCDQEPPPPEDEDHVGCIEECKIAYNEGEIDDAEMLLCLYDCCYAEAIADGLGPDEAARRCAPSTPAPPTTVPTCHQSCWGRFGVNTAAANQCIAEECDEPGRQVRPLAAPPSPITGVSARTPVALPAF